MKYQIINKELQIASCSIADLTMEQVQSFLKQWEPGDSIGTLTLFFDNNGLVVLNRDNKNYNYYKEFAEAYLSDPEGAIKHISDRVREKMRPNIEVLDNCIRLRTVGLEVDRASKNYIPGENHRRVLAEICRRCDNIAAAATTAFRYGVMAGKRMERARRKSGASDVSM